MKTMDFETGEWKTFCLNRLKLRVQKNNLNPTKAVRGKVRTKQGMNETKKFNE